MGLFFFFNWIVLSTPIIQPERKKNCNKIKNASSKSTSKRKTPRPRYPLHRSPYFYVTTLARKHGIQCRKLKFEPWATSLLTWISIGTFYVWAFVTYPVALAFTLLFISPLHVSVRLIALSLFHGMKGRSIKHLLHGSDRVAEGAMGEDWEANS